VDNFRDIVCDIMFVPGGGVSAVFTRGYDRQIFSDFFHEFSGKPLA